MQVQERQNTGAAQRFAVSRTFCDPTREQLPLASCQPSTGQIPVNMTDTLHGRREVKAERSRGRDVYLFPTRFLVTMASTQVRTHLARCRTDCRWLAVARLPTSYLRHTRTGSTSQTARSVREPHVIQIPTPVPADLPSLPHPVRDEAVGTSAVARCPG